MIIVELGKNHKIDEFVSWRGHQLVRIPLKLSVLVQVERKLGQ